MAWRVARGAWRVAQAHLGPPRFQPLDMATEAPAPGMLLALDAEFVMVSHQP